MAALRSRRGSSLMEVIITLCLLGTAGFVFAACFPIGFSTSKQGQEHKIAAAIAQRKMEELRAMNYESLTQPLLYSAGIIDAAPTSSTNSYSFTSTNNVASQLTRGTGTITIENVPNGLKRVQVTVTWQGQSADSTRSVCITTLFADKRTRPAK